ncbi:hypothetical protein WH194_23560, partial [Xanthomonas euvesicatoria]
MVIRAVQMAVWQRQGSDEKKKMVIRAVQMAVWQRQGSDKVIVHFCSMSAVGHCGDNAACEG